MRDNYKRVINYLRISVTDRCNLRCRYCMPEEGVELKPPNDILSLEEIVQIVKVASKLGVSRVRLTGGEPLVRKNLPYLVEGIKSIKKIEEVSLTTNGILLARYAEELKRKGLDRVNISLDSLKADRYAHITRGGDIERVWQGILKALEVGLEPVKINVVLKRDFNLDEVVDFALLTKKYPLHIRFIELMPLGNSREDDFISADEVYALISSQFPLERAVIPGNGPANYFAFASGDTLGSIGFIAAMTHNFCERCNRMRLTADGKLRPCLENELEVDLKPFLRGEEKETSLEEAFLKALELKPQKHHMDTAGHGINTRSMSQIGG